MCLHSTHVVGCYAFHCVEEDACRCVYILHSQLISWIEGLQTVQGKSMFVHNCGMEHWLAISRVPVN